MSQVVQIDNSKYEFEFFLVKGKGKADDIIPITKESIKYLEVEDSFANIGYVGKVIFSDFNSILEKIGIFKITDGNISPNFFIRFKNLDFEEINVGNVPEVFLLAALNDNTQTSKNTIDRHAAFEFDEYQVAELKRKSVVGVENIQELIRAISSSVTSGFNQATGNGTVQDLIVGLLERTTTLKIQTSPNPTKADITNLRPICIDPVKTVYQSIMELYNYLSYGNDIVNVPGIIKLQNVGNKDRNFFLTPFNQTILKFFELIRSSPTSAEVGNYLLEKFVISSQEYEEASLGENVISKYNIERVDYEDVLSKKWCSLIATHGQECNNNVSNELDYENLIRKFEQYFTGSYRSNLPERDNPIKKPYSTVGLPQELSLAYGVNKVFSSFIFDNIAITFRVKGNTYRDAGKFVEIRSDKPDVNGYWFIISVKHIFEESTYFNEITCVKFYDDTREGSPRQITTTRQNTSTTSSAPRNPAVPVPTISEPLPFEEPPGPSPGTVIDEEEVLPPLT